MPRMSTSDEAGLPTARIPSVPIYASESGAAPVTPAAVMQWIAAAGGQPWFPSRHATETGTERAALDEPLAQLRLSQLVRVATWVRGLGQGYVLTPEGQAAATAGTGIPDTKPIPVVPRTAEEVGEGAPFDDPESESGARDPVPDREREERVAAHFGLNLRRTALVPALIVANLLWFLAGVVAAVRLGHPLGQYLAEGNAAILRQFGAVSGADLLNGDWWRLLSSCFVHIGLLHLCANLFALAMMGPLAELLWGRLRLATIYFISGLAGSCLATASQPDPLLAGASGAIWGVLASLAAWLMLFRSQLPPEVAGDWARRLWLVFVLNAGVSFLPGVSWEAHLGGGVAGFISSGLLNALRFGPGPRRVLALLLLLAMPFVCIGGLGYTMARGEAWAGLRDRVARREAARKALAASAAEQERYAALVAAEAAFNRDVAPRLDRLAPEAVGEVQTRAVGLLMRPGERRKPETATETRARLSELKAAADEATRFLAGPPTGLGAFDEHRSRAGALAAARSESFALLLRMLDSPQIPDEAAWTAWGNSRRAADAAWEHVRRK